MAAVAIESEGYESEVLEPDRGEKALKAYQAAWPFAEGAIRQAPNWSEAYYLRGRIEARIAGELGRLGRGTEKGEHSGRALADLGRSIELNPRYASAYYLRATLNYMMGRPADAVPDFARAFELGPWNLTALKRKGLCLLATGWIRDGVRDLEAALQAVPEWAEELDPVLNEARRRMDKSH
jgi:tetratricopeptide (TPR) repeat protein